MLTCTFDRQALLFLNSLVPLSDQIEGLVVVRRKKPLNVETAADAFYRVSAVAMVPGFPFIRHTIMSHLAQYFSSFNTA